MSPIIPAPPYTYDDPRFAYDEPCMFYDGGFDEVCLANLDKVILPRRVGRSGGQKSSTLRSAYEETCETILDIKISVLLNAINGKHVPANKVEKKYHMRYKPITVSVDDILYKTKKYNISMSNLTSTITVPKVCSSQKVKLLPIKTIVSSSLERRVKKLF